MTEKTAWSHLPNAKEIDHILNCASDPNMLWVCSKFYNGGLDRDRYLMSWNDARKKTGEILFIELGRALLKLKSQELVRQLIWGALAALVAWEQSAQYLYMPSDELGVWAELSSDPAAILLLPAVIAAEKSKK